MKLASSLEYRSEVGCRNWFPRGNGVVRAFVPSNVKLRPRAPLQTRHLARDDAMKRPMLLATALCAGALLQAAALADVVQGTVTPATAKVIIKDGAGNQVGELAGGPSQVRVPAGRFKAECQAPSQKKVQIFSLAQPTTVNIDCT